MEFVFLFATTFFLSLSRKSPLLRKYFIGNTGCSVYLFGEPAIAETTRTKDNDVMHVVKCFSGPISYGVICIDLHNPFVNGAEAGKTLVNFMNSLHQPFSILHQTGMEEKTVNDGDLTITDYWQDKGNRDWKVKGWTNGQVVAVLFVSNISEMAVCNQDRFLESLSCTARKLA